MKWIEYDYVCNADKGINLHKKVEYNEANLAIAEVEACNGEYTITEDDSVKVDPLERTREKLGAAPNVLSEEAASALYLESGATVDDALRYLGKDSHQVGDTLRTYRTDLGENWALCNGAEFNPKEYPELAKFTPRFDAFANLMSIIQIHSMYVAYDTTYNGYAEGNGYKAIAYTATYPHVIYTTDDWATFTDIQVSTDKAPSGDSQVALCQIRFVNGYWIVIYGATGKCVYAEGTPDSTWTQGGSLGVNYMLHIFDIWYHNGMYCVAFDRNSTDSTGKYAAIATSSTPGFAGAAVSTLDNSFTYPEGFVRAEGRIAFLKSGASSSTLYYASIDAPTVFTSKTFTYPSYTEAYVDYEYSLAYVNGYYVFTGNGGWIVYSRDLLADVWSSYKLPFTFSSSGIQAPASYMCYARGIYVLPAGGLYQQSASNTVGDYGFFVNDNIENPDGWTFAMKYNKEIVANQSPSLCIKPVICDSHIDFFSTSGITRLPLYALPLSTHEHLYEFIKVKEGI